MNDKDWITDIEDWKERILDSYDSYTSSWEDKENLDSDWILASEPKIPITKAQAKMLEKVLGDDFFIGDEGIRDILEMVFDCGFYYERDREVLNLARECYLKGRNWIKGNS